MIIKKAAEILNNQRLYYSIIDEAHEDSYKISVPMESRKEIEKTIKKIAFEVYDP